MAQSKRRIGKYGVPKYWYHISTTLKKDLEILDPRNNIEGFNRPDHEPNVDRICVAPTLEQCLVSVPYSKSGIFHIYKTKHLVKARKAYDVFDAFVTGERWIGNSTEFIKIGILKLKDIPEHIITEAASEGNATYSKEVLKWWKKINPWLYVKKIPETS
jgi:hypothetical protein